MTILVVVTDAEDVPGLIGWADRFGQACERRLAVVAVQRLRGRTGEAAKVPFVLDEGESDDDPLLQQIRATLTKRREARRARVVALPADAAATSFASTTAVRVPTLWRLRHADPASAVVALGRRLDADMLLVSTQGGGVTEQLAGHLIRQATCTVLALRLHRGAVPDAPRLLVPAAGGPNARTALALAERLARVCDARLTALYIQDPRIDDAEAIGAVHLDHVLRDAGLRGRERIDNQVVLDRDVRHGIREAAAGHDLVVVGASDHIFISRMLFGTIGEHLLAGESGPTVAVLRSSQPWHTRVLGMIERIFLGHIPQMDREGRLELAESLLAGSRLRHDFVALVVLSTAIAGLGLLQNSTAVIVGAMLVAPLMTPIVGAGLGLVQGNAYLLRIAVRSIVGGFLLAFGVGFALGLMSAGELTPEMNNRGAPNLLDLFVAFFSGVAGSYALTRPGLSAALPGVAIAAAFVPPIATAGIATARGAFGTAQGSALLFFTNVIAIILASALTFYAVGLRPAHGKQWTPQWVGRLTVSLLGLVLILAVSLSSVWFWPVLHQERAVAEAIRHSLSDSPDHQLQALHYIGDTPEVWELWLSAPAAPTPVELQALSGIVATVRERPVRIRVRTDLVVEGAVHGSHRERLPDAGP